MSAIVAKVLNDTVGTPKFKGLNQILEEQLSTLNAEFSENINHLDEVLKENIEAIKDAVMPVSNLSNPVYAYREGDGAFYSDGRNVSSSTPFTSKTMRFGYEGFVAIIVDSILATEISGENIIVSPYHYSNDGKKIYPVMVKAGSTIQVAARVGGDSVVSYQMAICGHTEFAPSLNLEIVD